MASVPVSRQQAAVAAATAVARDHGLVVDAAAIVHDGSNLLVALRPAPVIARVAFAVARVRAGDGWLRREVAVAGHLAAAGAPVVAPSDLLDPGPHERDGFVLSFWRSVPATEPAPDGYGAGRALRACHEALAGWEGAAALPRWGVVEEARTLVERLAAGPALTSADAELLRETGARVQERVERLGLPLQAIHGDAHLRNVVEAPEGTLWADWEDAFLGPRGWDLACLYAFLPPFGDADPARVGQAYRGYGEPLHVDLLRPLVAARRFQAVVWGVVLAGGDPDRIARARRRLDDLRRRRGSAAVEEL